MTRLVLIVDDIKSNREILKNILGEEYSILEAAHGQEALAVLSREHKRISAVLLDLCMPVMDGFEVLQKMHENAEYSQIPVIVTTGQTDLESEEKALSLGAKDYISKPYKSAIIKQRIRNTINLRETAAAINAMQRDRLTGLYSREAFFDKTAELVHSKIPGYYIMACFDIDGFKVINDQYGIAKGDDVLRHIAEVFRKGFEPHGGICCRITADNFAVLYPSFFVGTAELAKIRKDACIIDGLASPITFSIGRYSVDDLTLTPSGMYDRALLAEMKVKGRYDKHIEQYDESMRRDLLDEQLVVTEMAAALKGKQFEVWFQPQYNHTSGALIGAEALVRWRHPDRGLISPGIFIPIFEKNGFVYELDKFVWEETCRYLRKWVDEGRSPLPISVNISRYDIFREDLVDTITGLVAKYGIPVDLLRLEITESAFAESTEQIVEIVRCLIRVGFTVEIDDFGSGYSSLNTLKSVPAQVVKLDMRFLEDDNDSQRGGNILESIVRMTKWLGMSVIAEGVEEKEQADFLKSIGCSYVQGYLYARPMPAADYEAHCRGIGKEERLLALETVENLDNNSFWDPSSMDTLIFNSYVGGACIYEYHDGNIELLRATEKYAQVIGSAGMTVEEALKLNWADHLDEKNMHQVVADLEESIETRREVTGEYVFVNLPGCPHETYLRSTMRVIASAGDRYLVYCTNENITAQRQAEQSERKVTDQLKVVMDNVNCGITATTATNGKAKLLFANNRYFELLGYTKEQYRAEVTDPLSVIFPEERDLVCSFDENGLVHPKIDTIEYRAIRRDGSIIWLRRSCTISNFGDLGGKVLLSFHTDLTAERQAAMELLDNLPCGAALYEYDGKSLTAVHINKRYWTLVDREVPADGELPVLHAVHPDDKKVIADELNAGIMQGRDLSCDIRVLHGSGGYTPFHVTGRTVRKSDGKYSIYAAYTPISDEAMSIQEMLPIALAAVLASSPDLSFVKDKSLRYICCSRAFARMVGLHDEKEVVGKTDYDLFDKPLADQYVYDDQQLMSDKLSIVDKIEMIPAEDGKVHFSSTSKFLMYDSQGNIVGLYGVGRDITEAREMSSRFDLLVDSIPGGIATYEYNDGKFVIRYFNDGFCRLFGLTREEYALLSKDDALIGIYSDDLPGLQKQLNALITNGTQVSYVYRVKLRDGSFKWVNLLAAIANGAEDRVVINAVLIDVTERQEALEHLRVSEEANRMAMQHSKTVVCLYDMATNTLILESGENTLFEMPKSKEYFPYGPVKDGKISPETVDDYMSFYQSVQRGDESGKAVFKILVESGWCWIEARFSTIFSVNGNPVSSVISYIDVSESIEREAAYKKWIQSFSSRDERTYSLYRCSVNDKTIFDAEVGKLLNIESAYGIFDFDSRTAEYVDKFVSEEYKTIFLEFLSTANLLEKYNSGKKTIQLDYTEDLSDGKYRWIRLTVDLVEHSRSTDIEAYILFEDIDEEKRTELMTIERAQRDPLTGVFNRTTFASRVDTAIAAAEHGTRQVLMMIDIDGFKQVNDAFGHSAGDDTLVGIANSIQSVLQPCDMLGRLGGDEFLVFVNDVKSEDSVAQKAKQICALIHRSLSDEVVITGSVGMAISPKDGTGFEVLYKKADAALYHVKGSGKDNFAFYRDEMSGEHQRLEFGTAEAVNINRKKKRMLIVEDNAIDYEMLAKIFEDEYIIEYAIDGDTALTRLRHFGSAVSVVLLDLMLPGINGFEVLERMQKSPELSGIPVIVVSGDGSRESGLAAIRAGATDFILKPAEPELLRKRVNSAIGKAESERLRIKNSILEYQNSEATRYKTVLDRFGTTVVEYDIIADSFIYDLSITSHIAGNYDERTLWDILKEDSVCDDETVAKIKSYVEAVAKCDEMDGINIRLVTPKQERHWFRLNIYGITNNGGLIEKLYMAFSDLGGELPK